MKVNRKKNLLLVLFAAALIIITGCSGASASAIAQPDVQQPSQVNSQQTSQQAAPTAADNAVQQNADSGAAIPSSVPIPKKSTSTNTTSPMAVQTAPPVLSNRVDVIYFHTKLRCVTCLCFEEQVTKLINNYFKDAIGSGKLTYRVLNVQDPKNTAIAKKYGAVGSQLFINNVINDFDNIEDIQNIWYWNCVEDPPGFDLKVKGVIEYYLKGKP